MLYIKQLKNIRATKRTQYTHNVMRKYVRFITFSCLTLCKMPLQFVIYLGSFAKPANMAILNVKTFSTAEAAMGKSSRCRYSTK